MADPVVSWLESELERLKKRMVCQRLQGVLYDSRDEEDKRVLRRLLRRAKARRKA